MIRIAVFTFFFALVILLGIYINWYDNMVNDYKERNGRKMTLAEKILEFIEDNYPTEVRTDCEQGCAYVLDEIEKICKAESEE